MKIIGTSNFDNNAVCDILICENIKSEFKELIVDFLNSGSNHNFYFFKTVEDDYKLHKFEP